MVDIMSLFNQVVLGVLLMVTLIVVALMVRVYSRTKSSKPQEQVEHRQVKPASLESETEQEED